MCDGCKAVGTPQEVKTSAGHANNCSVLRSEKRVTCDQIKFEKFDVRTLLNFVSAQSLPFGRFGFP